MSTKGPPLPRSVPVPRPVAVKKKVLEKDVEKYLYKRMKKLGGECYKWSSSNVRFVSDRICVFPTGEIWFIELKKDSKSKLSPGQSKFLTKMRELNVTNVDVLYGKEDVDNWLTLLGYYDK